MADGKDKTTDNEKKDENKDVNQEQDEQQVEYAETVSVDVDGNNIEVNYDEEGNAYIEEDSIPEGVSAEEVEKKIGKDNKVAELGQTLSKYKQYRTEQNEKLSKYDDILSEKEKLEKKVEKMQEEKTASERQIELGKIKQKDYSQIYEENLLKNLNLEEGEKLDDYIGTVKYHNASVKAQSQSFQEMEKAQQLRMQENLQNETKLSKIQAISQGETDSNISASDVYAYAQQKKMTHLPPQDIYNFYKSTHPEHNIIDKHNKKQNMKKSTLTIIPKSKKKPKTKKKDENKAEDEITDSISKGVKRI